MAKIKSGNPGAVWGFFAGADQIKFAQQYQQFVGGSIPLFGNTLSRVERALKHEPLGDNRMMCRERTHAHDESDTEEFTR